MESVSLKLLMISLLLSLVSVPALPNDWIHLGDRKVNHRAEFDTIHVGVERGKFSKIKLKIRRAPVRFFDFKVHFKNGDIFDVAMTETIPGGGATRIIDLPGGRRFIKKVVFHYKTRPRIARRAVVALWGRR